MDNGWPGRPWNFGALPHCGLQDAGVVIVPAPYEATVSYRSGTRLGPQAIIDASRNMELFEEETASEPWRVGLATLDEAELPTDPEAALAAIEPICAQVFELGKLLVTLGGEHTVSLAPIRAARAAVGEFSVLQLDAHADLRDSYLGSRYSHACTMRRAEEVAPVVAVGIRSFSAEEHEYMQRSGSRPFLARDIVPGDGAQLSAKALASQVVERLLPRVYVTIDLDAFDPGIMPAVGTPEPGGLGWYQALSLLRHVAASREIIGFDVVELCPLPGHGASDFLAARLVYKLVAYVLQHQRKARLTA